MSKRKNNSGEAEAMGHIAVFSLGGYFIHLGGWLIFLGFLIFIGWIGFTSRK